MVSFFFGGSMLVMLPVAQQVVLPAVELVVLPVVVLMPVVLGIVILPMVLLVSSWESLYCLWCCLRCCQWRNWCVVGRWPPVAPLHRVRH